MHCKCARLNAHNARWSIFDALFCVHFAVLYYYGCRERRANLTQKVRHKLYNALGIVVSACSKIIFQSNFMTFALCIFLSRIIYL